MKKCVVLALGLLALLILPGASQAAPAPDLGQLEAAIFAPAAQAEPAPAAPPEMGTPEPIFVDHCNENLPCAYHLCQCNHYCASRGGVQSVYCSPYWTCVCNQ